MCFFAYVLLPTPWPHLWLPSVRISGSWSWWIWLCHTHSQSLSKYECSTKCPHAFSSLAESHTWLCSLLGHVSTFSLCQGKPQVWWSGRLGFSASLLGFFGFSSRGNQIQGEWVDLYWSIAPIWIWDTHPDLAPGKRSCFCDLGAPPLSVSPGSPTLVS